jgi:hypothetical protein
LATFVQGRSQQAPLIPANKQKAHFCDRHGRSDGVAYHSANRTCGRFDANLLLSANSIELRIIEQRKFKLVKSATFARSRESL